MSRFPDFEFHVWGRRQRTITVQDTSLPEVEGVLVDSTNWSQPYLQAIEPFSQGIPTGFVVPSGESQILDLPWSNLNQVRIQFNENANVQQNSLTVTGQNVPQYAISGFSYDPATFTAVGRWPSRSGRIMCNFTSARPARMPSLTRLATRSTASGPMARSLFLGRWQRGRRFQFLV